jgi:hypothetical protein
LAKLVQRDMKPTLHFRALRPLRQALLTAGFAAVTLTGVAAPRSTTVIQPPAPPGLPAPPSVGDVIRVEKAPPAARDETVPRALVAPVS